MRKVDLKFLAQWPPGSFLCTYGEARGILGVLAHNLPGWLPAVPAAARAPRRQFPLVLCESARGESRRGGPFHSRVARSGCYHAPVNICPVGRKYTQMETMFTWVAGVAVIVGLGFLSLFGGNRGRY